MSDVAKRWYVLRVSSGYEAKIKEMIEALIRHGEIDSDVIGEVYIPYEEVSVIKNRKRSIKKRKSMPGYMLVEVSFTDKNWADLIATLRKISGVMGFVGGKAGELPPPVSDEEARTIIQRGESRSSRDIRVLTPFVEGETIRVVDGPFSSFTGIINAVENDKAKLRISVEIFGRTTPMELDFTQVEKA